MVYHLNKDVWDHFTQSYRHPVSKIVMPTRVFSLPLYFDVLMQCLWLDRQDISVSNKSANTATGEQEKKIRGRKLSVGPKLDPRIDPS